MDKYEILANEMIAESIQKLIDKTQKKADKERAKIKNATVTYQGITYSSEGELMEAYSCDCFSSSVYDRLLDKLNAARDKMDPFEMTPSEMLLMELNKHRNTLLAEVALDKELKRRQAEKDDRISELTAEGYSIREAKTIVENEELMRYE